MGMCAEVIAIGPYTKAIANFLDYDSEYYAATNEGSIISRRLFGISEGSTVSRELAALLGINNAWDFNQHKVDTAKIDIAGLREFAKKYIHYKNDVEILEGLQTAGFEFHFRPEG